VALCSLTPQSISKHCAVLKNPCHFLSGGSLFWIQGLICQLTAHAKTFSTKTEAEHCAGYEWAIITTGPPTIPSGDGCRTGSADGGIADVAQRGFWWFTRQQEAPAAALEALRKKSLVSPLTWHSPLLGKYRPRKHMSVSSMLHKNSSQLNARSHAERKLLSVFRD
jgi:hypothetical protein